MHLSGLGALVGPPLHDCQKADSNYQAAKGFCSSASHIFVVFMSLVYQNQPPDATRNLPRNPSMSGISTHHGMAQTTGPQILQPVFRHCFQSRTAATDGAGRSARTKRHAIGVETSKSGPPLSGLHWLLKQTQTANLFHRTWDCVHETVSLFGVAGLDKKPLRDYRTNGRCHRSYDKNAREIFHLGQIRRHKKHPFEG